MKKIRRTDIDTLRGVSVLSVIIFHIDNEFFPNGYLGVDLFFVISGYVISKSIFKDLQNNEFSFLNFYLKRARRILPALLSVLLITLIVASIVFLTADLKRYSESLISALGFVSNFYFWITGGYFSTNDQLKPLLHLWSLSVEEQFYLFFPLLIYAIFKIKNKINFYLFITIIITICSYLLNLYFISSSDAVFFLFPARIWQFGIGVIFALSPHLLIKNIWLDTLYLLLALILISFNFIYSISFLPDGTLMCIGLGLILFKSMNQNNLLFNIFKIKPLIFIGLISYSLYLWHWPIISFLKYIYLGALPILIIIFSCFLIFILSVLSWKFIEQPFLNKYTNKKTISFIGVNYFVLFAISLFIIFSKTLPSRYEKYPNLIANSAGPTNDCSPITYKKFNGVLGCYVNKKAEKTPSSVLLGNSHAFMYRWPYIEYLKKRGEQGFIFQWNCLPYIDKNYTKTCLSKARLNFNSIISTNKIKNVFIGLTWYSENFVDENGKKYQDTNFDIRKKSINYLIDKLVDSGKNVYLIGPIPKPNFDFISIYSRQLIFGDKKYPGKESREVFDNKYGEVIKYYENRFDKKFIQPHKIICDRNYCFFADENGAIFADGNHLSKYGSMKMINFFKEIYKD